MKMVVSFDDNIFCDFYLGGMSHCKQVSEEAAYKYLSDVMMLFLVFCLGVLELKYIYRLTQPV